MARYTDDMELEDAIHTAILTLKEGWVKEGTQRCVTSKEQICNHTL